MRQTYRHFDRCLVHRIAALFLGAMILAQAGSAPAQSASAPDRLKERNALAWEALRLREAGKTAEGIVAADKMLAVERQLYPDGEELAGALEFVAGAHSGHADFEGARDRLKEALAIRERVQSKDYWQTIDSRYALQRLGPLTELDASRRERYREGMRLVVQFNQVGHRTYEAAELLDRKQKAAAILKDALGKSSPEYALYLDQLGWFYRDRINSARDRVSPEYKKAAAIFREALEIRKHSLGDEHPDVAKSLENLVDFPGEDDGAEFPIVCLRKALAIRVKTQGEGHPDVSRVLMRLADQLSRTAEGKEEALGHYERAQAILESTRGEHDPGVLSVLQRIGMLAESLGDSERQERALMRRVALGKARLEKDRSPFAMTWIGRLGTPPDPGALRFAHRWSAFAMREVHALTLSELSRFHGVRGNVGRAGQYLREAMNVYAENLERHAAVAQDQQHYDPHTAGTYVLALDRFLALSLDPRAEITADEAYRQVLSWKGGYFAFELQARRWRDRPETAALARELREASDRLAALALASPAPEDRDGWNAIMRELGRRDGLEAELADLVSRLSAGEARERPDVDRLKLALPADTALVDFKVFMPWVGWGDAPVRPDRRLMAFVIRSKGPVERIDLGPWTPFQTAIQEWRRYALAPSRPADASLSVRFRQERSGRALATLRLGLWEPLAPHIVGAATLLVSPDSDLCKFPLQALPGGAPGSYLVEELAVAVVPVPRLLILGQVPAAPQGAARLIAVGDVDYDSETGSVLASAERAQRGPSLSAFVPRARMMKFGPLDSTAREVEAVRERFTAAFPRGEAILLRGKDATEGAFRKALPGARFVHLATHGFFEPPELAPRAASPGDELSYWSTPQGLVRLSPGLLSGVAFAGANHPPAAGRDDGLFTAVEAQQLDLRGVDVVVLSACETALGSESRGEGLIGLQRALQVAGARTLVSSLWPVDDTATTLLMEEFYTNLWQRRLPKLEALRQAQLTLLNRYDPRTQTLKREPRPGPRLAADLWAAFTLSGDWR